MYKITIIIFLITAFNPMFLNGAEVQGLSDYVNPFIGASTDTSHSYHGLGKTFPGATTPYGLCQVSPNTITGGDNGSGYSYEHTHIEGFAFMQMSGVGWYGDLGNFLVMPTTGSLKTSAGNLEFNIDGYRSHYKKDTEVAKASYYSVRLTDYDIQTEATAVPHGGILRFTFPENKQSRIQIDLARRVGGTSVKQSIEILNDNTISGWMLCTPEGGGWGNGAGHADYVVYFYAEFSKPFTRYGMWSADIPDSWARKLENVTSKNYQTKVANSHIYRDISRLEGKHIGFFTEFETQKDEVVTLKVGISLVDGAGAKNNFDDELNGKTFDTVYAEAKALWDAALNKIYVEGGSEDDKVVFYTALYHTMLDPRIISDVDGRYPGGNKQIQHAATFKKRSVFSGWDVFRSQFPLQTIINRELVNDLINSLVTLAEENKTYYYDRWEFLNAYSGCMVGNPALSILADAFVKDIRAYDIAKVYQFAKNTADKFGNGSLGYSGAPYSISNTLEYAYSDWCMSILASHLGKQEDFKTYSSKANAYKNVFDADKGWFRPRTWDGTWEKWSMNAKTEEWYGCIESNLYQQGWFVPHDILGLIALLGGKESMLHDLIRFFESTPEDLYWNPYYNHANEPVHHVPFLFNRLDAPWLTQKWTRHICQHAYKNNIEGLVGNDDVGQMSAWYVLAASGIHPICPGDTKYEITSPVFDKICMNLESGKQFRIVAKNNSSKDIYIQKMELNGVAYMQYNVDYSTLINGGELVLYMGPSPPIINKTTQ